MGIFDKFKKKLSLKPKAIKKQAKVEIKKVEKKEVKPKYSTLKPKTEDLATAPKEIKGKPGKKTETKEAYRILIKPLVTEKATNLVASNQYSFMVAKSANKIEIQKAIKGLYGFEPLAVNIINMRGKRVRTGRVSGKKKNWKKAIVTLKPGEKIEIYEGV
jgi:large subunit ribosomal protein L23